MQDIVMIPGLGSDAAVWQPTIDVLGPTVRCQVGDTLSDETLADMAMRILDDAPAHFALAGVSMGGMVALEIMKAAPERVTKLALIDTNARDDTPEQSAQRRAANAAILETDDLAALAAHAINDMVDVSAGEDVRRAMVDMAVRVGAAAYARQNSAMIARCDLRSVLPTIEVPTLVVVGENDTMTPLACSQEICDGIAEARLEMIKKCGHLPPIEKPNAMAKLLREHFALPNQI
jgi:pimeloyl-ACP methyl ester carboxylesterase